MKRKIYAIVLLFAITAGTIWAQGRGPAVVIVQRSQTDRPAVPGQASDEATAVAHYLETQVAIQIQDRFPCASAITDQDARALLDWERQRQLLGKDDPEMLANLAASFGAKYIISVTATQVGGRTNLQASCINGKTGQVMQMKDKMTSGGTDAVNGAESLAQDFVKSLGGLFSATPESGKSYPAGTVFKVDVTNTWEDHVLIHRIRGEFHRLGAPGGFDSVVTGGAYDSPKGWGDCGGCKSCSCAGNSIAQFVEPGRYRLLKVTQGIAGVVENKETIAEFTIAGKCKK